MVDDAKAETSAHAKELKSLEDERKAADAAINASIAAMATADFRSAQALNDPTPEAMEINKSTPSPDP